MENMVVRRRRRRRRQRGRGLDIQKWLGKTGLEFHWPGYRTWDRKTTTEKIVKKIMQANVKLKI